ncbi:MAG: EAL domain-containing protein [Gloeomargarita sp. SKYB31]|nr:EAL domain-containing protein [Gloeomargarita sp. SKYB31]
MDFALDQWQQALRGFPYPVLWVEQQADGQYDFHGFYQDGFRDYLPPAWEPLRPVVITCLQQQVVQRQRLTVAGVTYLVEFTPLSLQEALGLAIPESELGQLAEAAPVVLWLADTQGAVVYVNRQWTVLTQQPVLAALGDGWWRWVHPDDQPHLRRVFQQAVASRQSYRVEFRLRNAQGEYLWLACQGHPRYNARGEWVGFLGVAVDITARRQAEQTTQLQARYNQFLVNLSTEILQSFDLDRIMQCAVTQLQALLGVDRVAIAPVAANGTVTFTVEAVADPRWQLLHTQIYDPCFDERYLAAYRQGRICVIEDVTSASLQPCHRALLQQFHVQANLVVPIRHGDHFWGLLIFHHCQQPRPWTQAEIHLVQQVANYLGLALHRGELYEQLQQQETRYRQIVEQQTELICRHTPQGQITFVNPAFCTYVGQTAVEIAQQPATTFALVPGEQRLRRADGSWGWVQWQVQPITNDRGETVEFQWVGRDVTAAHQAQEQLKLMESVVVCANDGIVITRQGRVIYANPTFLAMTGYTLAEIQAHGLGELCGPGTDLTQWEYIQNSVKQRASVRVELVQYAKDQRDFWVELTVLSLAGPEKDEWVWVYRDITDQKQIEARLLYEATHDALTGLPNRTFLMDRLHQAHRRCQPAAGQYYAVLFTDLDRFKLVNDSLGHTAGDEMLQEVARRLQRHLRPSDMLARIGGDEFVVLLEPVSGVAEAVAIAEQLLRVLQAPFLLQGQEVVLSSSIGICLNDNPDCSPADILRNADIAMYQVKLAGRCGVQVFQPRMHAQVMGQLALETALRRGLTQGEFVLYYQPVVHLQTGDIVGFEALVRWQQPGVGLVSPGVFIPVAEESGLIHPLSEWVLETTCQQLAQWRQQRPDLKVAINLSGQLFRRTPTLVTQITQALARWQLPPRSLVLEVTEGILMADPQTVGQALSELRQQGVQVSIDDFGTGYSSLARLQRLPVDCLKIDRSFIQQMTQRGALVQAIITLALTLEKDVIAEGIETPEQLALLQSFSPADRIYGQGYWFSPPVPAAAATKLLQQAPPWRAVRE